MATKKKTNKQDLENASITAQLYAWLSCICFGIVIIEPLWHFNHDTISASIFVLIGWITAIISTKIK